MLRIACGLLVTSVLLGTSVASAAGKIVINEVFVNPPGDDDGKEWVELYNSGDAAMLIGGYKIEGQSDGAAVVVATVVADTVLPAGQYYVIGGTQVPGAQQNDLRVNVGGTILNAGAYGARLRLLNTSSLALDSVVYGADNDNLLTDDTGAVAATLAPVPITYATLSRIPNGTDTQSGADFKNVEPTPGAANQNVLPPVPDGGAPDGGESSSGGSSGASSSSGTASSSSSGSSSGVASSSSGGSSGKSSSSGSSSGKSSSSGGKSSGGKSSSGSSSGEEDGGGDGTASADDEGGCNTSPGGSLSLAALLGVGAMALLRRRRKP